MNRPVRSILWGLLLLVGHFLGALTTAGILAGTYLMFGLPGVFFLGLGASVVIVVTAAINAGRDD